YVDHQPLGGAQQIQAFFDVVVKHRAVGDYDDRVEHRCTSIVDDTTCPVSQPRNGLRLTRTRRVLNQVTATSTTCSDIVDNLLSSPQLVVTREDQPTLITLGRWLPQGVVTQNSQKQLRLEDFLPQIRGIRAVWI